MKRFRTLKLLFVFALIIAAGFYFLRIHRYSHTVQRSGWHLDYATPAMACQCCFSRISRLEYNGKPIPMPQFPVTDDNRWRRSSLHTPIGKFRIFNSFEDWRYFFGDSRLPEYNETPITKEDLRRGYYVATYEEISESTQWPRKKGTPEHWCILYGTVCCWVDPLRLDEVDWEDISPTGEE
ncbi:MAG: hypothetical protein GXP29_06630 [Planctomycetes bacterium]|nr:hypothetical protein [Planctomycetota bacterium]